MTIRPDTQFHHQEGAEILPTLEQINLKHNNQEWIVYHSQEFHEMLDRLTLSGQLITKLVSYINFCSQYQKNLRTILNINGAPITAYFQGKSNWILLGSGQFQREIFLVKKAKTESINDPKERIKYEKWAKLIDEILKTPNESYGSSHQFITYHHHLTNFLGDHPYKAIEGELSEKVSKIKATIDEYKPSLIEKISDYGLLLTAKYPIFRVHLLKFLAILPSIDHDKSGKEVKRLFQEALNLINKDNKGNNTLPLWMTLSIKIVYWLIIPIPGFWFAHLVRRSVRKMAKRFIAGENIDDALTSLKDLRQSKRDATLDQLGELVISEQEAQEYLNRILELMNGISQQIPKGQRNAAGILSAHISIKVSGLCSHFNPQSLESTYQNVAPKLRKILLAAKRAEVFINIDAEHYANRNLVFEIYKKVLLETEELKDYADTGIVLQAYLKDSYEHFLDILNLAKQRNLIMPIRLVKGAYWDAEVIESQAHHFAAPEFYNKEETDLMFRQLIIKTLENPDYLQLALASHNIYDHCYGAVLKEKFFPNSAPIEHQCLHMTYEGLSVAMSQNNFVVRNYVPIGDLLVGMAYLVRRIMENSSQVGFLNQIRSFKKGQEQKIQFPETLHNKKLKYGHIKHDPSEYENAEFFHNVSPLRGHIKNEKEDFDRALAITKSKLGKTYLNSFPANGPLVEIYCSSMPETIVGKIQFATKSDVQSAITKSLTAFKNDSWSTGPAIKRSLVMMKAAQLLLIHRCELASLITFEAGKAINEALADVDEAVDFLNYYANQEFYLDKECSIIRSKGVVAVIAPWNFPLAIPCGMTSAALVSGNTVILKSAEQTPLVAQKLVDLFHKAGVPKDVVIHLPGEGEVVGAELVESKDVAMYVFTGSKNVGEIIYNNVSKRFYQHPHTKQWSPVKAITEMGGKNTIIVTSNAELDEAVSGCLASAYGHAGQKCSALSRILVDQSILDRFIERFTSGSLDYVVGKAYDHATQINPVISREDKLRLQQAVQKASQEALRVGGKVLIDRSQEEAPGYCIGPAAFLIPKSLALDTDSYAQKELFGPVVHIIAYKKIDEAIKIFNHSSYALTGGIFSQSQSDIDYILPKLEVGNVYVNRTCTGARVGIEPFGGFKLSGTGPKAGGKHYLKSFHLFGDFDYQLNQNKILSDSMPSTTLDKITFAPFKKKIDMSWQQTTSLCRQKLLEHYFDLFPETSSAAGLKILEFFHLWLKEHINELFEKKHWNVTIPGQLSYNNYSQRKRHGLLLAAESEPDITTLQYFFSSLALGLGTTILAQSSSAFHKWIAIKKVLCEAGLKDSHLPIYLINFQDLSRLLHNPEMEYFILEGPHKHCQAIIEIILSKKTQTSFMKKILTTFDHPHNDDFESFLLSFINVRSIAINTMRHGAPLDLSEQE